jgi:hypothetical protein
MCFPACEFHGNDSACGLESEDETKFPLPHGGVREGFSHTAAYIPTGKDLSADQHNMPLSTADG